MDIKTYWPLLKKIVLYVCRVTRAVKEVALGKYFKKPKTVKVLKKDPTETEAQDQLKFILEGGELPSLCQDKLIANEELAASKEYILISVTDNGTVKTHTHLKGGNDADYAACQIACAQLADELYEYIANGHSNNISDTDSLEDYLDDDDDGGM